MVKDLLVINQKTIEDRILNFRNIQVMLDRDLAEFYGVETKRLNEQVKRNIERFPKEFRFQLSNEVKSELVANCDRFESLKHSSVNPYVFTEQGVAMLSAVLKSKTAIKVSIQIINAFVEMRKFLFNNAEIFQRMNILEKNYFELKLDNDKKFEEIFSAMEQKKLNANQGIFYNGQVFDAYILITEIIRTAEKTIILIDNYIDETVLLMLSKRNKGVKAIIYTRNIDKALMLDIEKHNSQYEKIEFKRLETSHDRFIIIDNKNVFHFGASLKDAGKKWFAFSLLDIDADDILTKIDN